MHQFPSIFKPTTGFFHISNMLLALSMALISTALNRQPNDMHLVIGKEESHKIVLQPVISHFVLWISSLDSRNQPLMQQCSSMHDFLTLQFLPTNTTLLMEALHSVIQCSFYTEECGTILLNGADLAKGKLASIIQIEKLICFQDQLTRRSYSIFDTLKQEI
jgi:hypothetical protein